MDLYNESGKHNCALIALVTILQLIPLQVVAAEEACRSFMLQGNELIVDDSADVLVSGTLATIVSGLGDGEALSVNFSSSQLCVTQNSLSPSAANATRFVINSQAQELAVQAQLAGGIEVWLRVSPDYQSELLLDRAIGEKTGLTDMEFLSDNSGVGAEDFFAEPIDYLELGEMRLDSPFAEVPRFGVSYEHYEQGVDQSESGFRATQGILGYDLLRRLTLTFSPSAGLVLFSN